MEETYIPTVHGDEVYCEVVVASDEGRWLRRFEIRRISLLSEWIATPILQLGPEGPPEVYFRTSGPLWWYDEVAVALAERIVEEGKYEWEVIYDNGLRADTEPTGD